MRIVKESQGIHRVPNPKILSGTNYYDVGFERDPPSRRVVVMSAIANLQKGDAGQAVQALNVPAGGDARNGPTPSRWPPSQARRVRRAGGRVA